jgi:hypothetical protein
MISHLRVEAEREVCECAGVQLVQRIRQHTSAYVSIRQVYVRIRQHTSAYVSIRTTICEVCECAGMQLVQRLERQYLYLCTSKASKLSACMTAGGIVSGDLPLSFICTFVLVKQVNAVPIRAHVLVKQVNQAPA